MPDALNYAAAYGAVAIGLILIGIGIAISYRPLHGFRLPSESVASAVMIILGLVVLSTGVIALIQTYG